jgi:hypothetical protein
MRPPQSSLVRNLGTGLASGLGRRVGAGLPVSDYDQQAVKTHADRRVRTPSGAGKYSSGVADSSSESLPSPE